MQHYDRARSTSAAVILAAGRGSRLAGLTERKPKCLLPVGPSTLLEHQVTALADAGVRELVVVVGYRQEQIRERLAHIPGVRFVVNDVWDSTNSLYSIWLCREAVQGNMLVLNSDVLMHGDVLHRLLTTPGSSFAYDSCSGNEDEHMKVHLQDGRLVAMSKKMVAARVHGENVGVLHFESAASRSLFETAGDVIRTGGRNMWMAAAVQKLAKQVRLVGVDVSDLPWTEIDFAEDLAHARAHTLPHIERQSSAFGRYVARTAPATAPAR